MRSAGHISGLLDCGCAGRIQASGIAFKGFVPVNRQVHNSRYIPQTSAPESSPLSVEPKLTSLHGQRLADAWGTGAGYCKTMLRN